MNLLRFRPRVDTRRLVLPDGSSRKVKVSVNDAGTTQHIEDGDVLHGTARPDALHLDLRGGPDSIREYLARRHEDRRKQRYVRRHQPYAERPDGLWAPLPEGELA